MGSTRSKAQLLDELKDEQACREALLGEISEAHMQEPGVAGDWSIKDIVAHLTGWRHRTVARFQAALRHESSFSTLWPTHLETDDEINAWLYAANKDRPLSDALEESPAVFGQLVDTLSAFPEAELLDPGASTGWKASRSQARSSSAIFTRNMSRICAPGWRR